MASGRSPLFDKIGPPAPLAAIYMVRSLQVSICALVLWWIVLLSGVRFSPKPSADGSSNDTSQLFNWHPLLMTFAFVVCMGEAVLAYKRPVLSIHDRPTRKLWHATLHSLALISGILGLTAAIKSHTLKKPNPIPNFYSVHSFIGLLVCILFSMQYLLGILAYVAPTWSQPNRAAFGSLHAFLGLTTFTGGIAAMAVGIQEKTTFIQAFVKPDLTAAIMRIPAFTVLLLVLYAAAVLFHHAPSPPAAEQPTSPRRFNEEALPLREQF